MKRMHIHVAVEKLEASVRFYSTLFGAGPRCSRRTTPNGCSMTLGSIL
jgi:predicted enzyme related to lactoylglutathione lyase